MATQPIAFHVMTKPIGPICNLDCRYCFYLEKEGLYQGNRRWEMPDDVLREYVRQYIQSQQVPEVHFAWQGGEPTLLGVRFFEKVVEYQREFADGKQIHNAIQTNGTLLDDEWGGFLAANGFLIGVSIDGRADLHDAYRVDKRGNPTFEAVVRGLRVLKKHGAEFNTLTVVNRLNGDRPLDVYRFLRNEGSGFMQFIPLVERTGEETLASPLDQGAPVTEWSVGPEQFGTFLCSIYDEWIRRDVGRIFVQHFDVALNIWYGRPSPICVFRPTCGNAMALEHNGDLYACDHYVYPEFKLGNLMGKPVLELALSEKQVAFGQAKRDALTKVCRECDVRFACNGDCPKHRFALSAEGEPGHSYLCPSFLKFFRHIGPTMSEMADLLRRGQPPAAIVHILADRERKAFKGVGRNDPCPCGSGKKFKKCCEGKKGSQ